MAGWTYVCDQKLFVVWKGQKSTNKHRKVKTKHRKRLKTSFLSIRFCTFCVCLWLSVLSIKQFRKTLTDFKFSMRFFFFFLFVWIFVWFYFCSFSCLCQNSSMTTKTTTTTTHRTNEGKSRNCCFCFVVFFFSSPNRIQRDSNQLTEIFFVRCRRTCALCRYIIDGQLLWFLIVRVCVCVSLSYQPGPVIPAFVYFPSCTYWFIGIDRALRLHKIELPQNISKTTGPVGYSVTYIYRNSTTFSTNLCTWLRMREQVAKKCLFLVDSQLWALSYQNAICKYKKQ